MIPKSIAILTTGDELINGDTLNTNGPAIARDLFAQGFTVGQQLTISDDQQQLEHGMQYLLERHQVLITIGGLGPTSDDRTRFALSDVLNQPLVFHDESWERITARTKQLNLPLADSNKQQALFPADAKIIPNVNGSADAGEINTDSNIIFMLPGPPRECLPIFEETVLPKLIELGLQQPVFRKHWLLMGISESQLAHQLDPLLDDSVTLGYRFAYPYIEVKLGATDANILAKKTKEMMPIMKEFIVSKNKQTASEQLIDTLKQYPGKIAIIDTATGGRLQATLHTANTADKLLFGDTSAADLTMTVGGLDEYWQQQTGPTKLIMHINTEEISHTLNFLGDKGLDFAVELVCKELNAVLMS